MSELYMYILVDQIFFTWNVFFFCLNSCLVISHMVLTFLYNQVHSLNYLNSLKSSATVARITEVMMSKFSFGSIE